MQTAVEQLMIALYEGGYLRGNGNEMDDILEKYKEMEKQKIIKSILMWDVHTTLKEEDKGSMSEIEEFVAETYGSKGSDELGSSLEWNGEVTNGNNVEKVPNVASAKEILDFTTKQATEINWGGVVQHIPNICNCHQSNCHLINGKYICASCNKTLNVETQPITSSQTEISEPNPQLIESMCYRYRHDFGFLKDNHKESIRTTMKQLWEEVVGKGFYKQKEISDDEIEKAKEYHWSYRNGFVEGAKWYREQLKKKQ